MPHKLLLADDSVTIQRVIELTFADEDIQVLAVGDGQKAIASIQTDRPDIVLADVGMPERDGYEVAAFIKGDPQLANIPVLLLTGAFEPIDETRARAVGCDGVLVKPFEPQMVINRVKDLLAGRRPAGLWGAKPPAPAPTREAPPQPAASENLHLRPAATGAVTGASASLEDYFDRLDAAFASVEAAIDAQAALPTPAAGSAQAPRWQTPTVAGAAPMSPSGLSVDDLSGWDPDLAGDPERSAAVEAAPPPAAVEAAPAPAAVEAARAPTAVDLSQAASSSALPPGVAPAPISASPAPAAPQSPAASIPVAATATTPAAPPVQVSAVHVSAPEYDRAPQTPSPSPAPLPVQPAVSTASPASGALPIPSLAEAFAALLSAEHGRTISPSTVGRANVSDDTIDEIVRRVIAHMTNETVRDAVIGVAERLVREEIERIKQGH